MQNQNERIISCPVLEEMQPEDRQLFLQKSRPVQIPAGNLLFFQGDVCPDILLLEKGKIRVYIQNEEGEEITLYTLEPGEQCIINASSVISKTPALGTAVTLTDIEGLLLDVEGVREMMLRSKPYQEFMFSLFALRLQSLAELVEDIRFRPLEKRLIKWLKDRNQTEITTTHEAIAADLGSSRVVISRLVKKLEHEGRLKLGRGHITLMGPLD